MEVIRHTINAMEADGIETMRDEVTQAHIALEALEFEKLREFESKVREAKTRHPYDERVMAPDEGDIETPRQRRAIKDIPQA